MPVTPPMILTPITTPGVTTMVQMLRTTMVVVMVAQIPVRRADLGAKDLGVPLRGRAFRFNLASLNFRCNP